VNCDEGWFGGQQVGGTNDPYKAPLFLFFPIFFFFFSFFRLFSFLLLPISLPPHPNKTNSSLSRAFPPPSLPSPPPPPLLLPPPP